MSIFWPKLSLICLIIISINSCVESRKERIKLKDISVLTLKPNHWTTGRRTAPVPQLQCVGGLCDAIKGQTVQCYNRGSDGVDVQWECRTQINSNYKLGSVDVICEGFDSPDDDYVLIGSCGLEYTIESAVNYNKPNSNADNDYTYSQYKSKPSNHFSFGFIVCIVVIIFIIYYTCLRPNTTPNDNDFTRRTTGAPPPPPGFRSDFFGASDGCSSSSGFGTHQRPNTNPNTGSGFFSGLFTGGALGYLFGSRNTTNYRDQSSYFGRRVNPSPFFSDSNTRSSGSSTTTTTTSGFGGTKRR